MKQINSLQIPLPSDFNTEECLWFLNRNFDDCIYRIEDNTILRAIKVNNDKFSLKIEFKHNLLNLSLLVGEWNPDIEKYVCEFVNHWFDLETDLSSFNKKLESQKALKYMPEDFASLRFISMPDLYEALCWCIIGQQINLKFAYTIKRRLVEHYGDFVLYNDEKYYLFPSPEILQDADPVLLREMQFSMSKANYLINISKAFASGDISVEKLSSLPDLSVGKKCLQL